MLRGFPIRPAISLVTISILILAIVLVITGCQRRGKAPEHLRILFTSDTQGYLTPSACREGPHGGMERRATAIAEARASAPGQVILVDTGNFSTGLGTDFERMKAEYVIRATAQIGYDAVNVGHLDARQPREEVIHYDREGCPLTSTGYTFENEETGERESSYPPRIIIERDGFRIGILGSPLDDIDPEDLGAQNEPTVTGPELMDLIDQVYMEDGAGMVFLISDMALPRQQAHIIASRFPLASLVIAGASANPRYQKEGTGADVQHPLIIPRADGWGRSLGVLDLDLSPSGGIIGYRLRYVDLNEDIEKDSSLAGLTEEYLEAGDIEPTGVPPAHEAGYLGPNACQSCHGLEYESWTQTGHAAAWDTLEATGRLGESTCVPCHTTGYIESEYFPARLVPREFQSIGCETCHGPGRDHILFRRWRNYGEPLPETWEENPTDPIALTPSEETCTRCHFPPHDEGWLYTIKLDRVRHD